MASSFSRVVGAVALACTAAVAHADVLTFEDRPAGPAFFLADYNGFRFGTNSIQTTAWFSTDENSIYYKPKSGTHYISTDYQLYPSQTPLSTTQSITSTVDFKFDGAWFSGFDVIQYKLYNNGALVYTSGVSGELTDTPVFVGSGYQGLVDEVVVLGTQGYYAMDDFTFNTPVPEAGTLGMMAAGMLAIGASLRRRVGR